MAEKLNFFSLFFLVNWLPQTARWYALPDCLIYQAIWANTTAAPESWLPAKPLCV